MYAIDKANNISLASGIISIDYSVNIQTNSATNVVNILYNHENKTINIKSDAKLKQLNIYNMTGKTISKSKIDGYNYIQPVNQLKNGLYIVEVVDLHEGKHVNKITIR